MKAEVFELLLKFHLELIRKAPSQATIDNARSIMVEGKDPIMKGRNRYVLHDNLLTRQKDLTDFYKADWNEKTKVYGRAYKKKPSQGVFSALQDVLMEYSKVGTAATKHEVNGQAVKSLQPRFERYTDYSINLSDML